MNAIGSYSMIEHNMVEHNMPRSFPQPPREPYIPRMPRCFPRQAREPTFIEKCIARLEHNVDDYAGIHSVAWDLIESHKRHLGDEIKSIGKSTDQRRRKDSAKSKGYRKKLRQTKRNKHSVILELTEEAMLTRIESMECCFPLGLDHTAMALDLIQYDTAEEKKVYMSGKCVFNPATEKPFVIQQSECCVKCFGKYLAIPYSSLMKVIAKLKNNERVGGSLRGSFREVHPKTHALKAWLTSYASMYGDIQPDCAEVHVPDFYWSHVWLKYKNQADIDIDGACGYNTFTAFRREYCGWIKLRKVKKFAECQICSYLNELMRKALTATATKQHRMTKDDHLIWQSTERMCYYEHRSKSIRYCTTHRSIAIDGMDQSKTDLPSFKREPKDFGGLTSHNVHVTAALVHGEAPTVYLTDDRLPSDSSMTIEFIILLLEEMAANNNLPSTLYIQLDNTTRENKNRYVVSFLHMLVHFGIISYKVKLSFLPVGHTHEDVDRFFSRLSVWLKHRAIYTLTDMINGIKRCFTPQPRVFEVKSAGLWNRFLDDHIATSASTHKITKPRVFIIKKDPDGIVRHYWKEEMQSKKRNNPACINPLNRLGYVMFPKGFPKYPFDMVTIPKR
jgi:hypothetical protein